MASNDITSFQQLIETVHRLRAPQGCPWDRAQTHQSLRPYLIEEAYEVLDVIDQISSPDDIKKQNIQSAFKEELGDLLMQVMLHSEMTRETGAFDVFDVAATLNEKLIRRHPHVFGDVKVDGVESAFQTWEKQKAKEKSHRLDASILDGVPKGLPALQKAARVIEKVTRVGFQWADLNGPLDKITEELEELKAEVKALEALQKSNSAADPEKVTQVREHVASEFGDLFFTIANVAFLMKISPEDALRGTLSRFERRFKHVERRLKEQGRTPEQSTLAEMDLYWDEAKQIERGTTALLSREQ